MERGYIKLWRKMLDSLIIKNPNAVLLFVYILLKAAYKPTEDIVRKKEVVQLDTGQMVFSLRKAASDLGLGVRSIRTALSLLEQTKMVTQLPTRTHTIITVINWDTYQGNKNVADTVPDTLKTHLRHSSDTVRPPHPYLIKEFKELKNIKGINSVSNDTEFVALDGRPASPPQENSSQVLLTPEPTKDAAKSKIPYDEIVKIYHETLPELPTLKVISENRKKAIKGRYAYVVEWLKKRGRETSKENALAYFRNFFAIVQASDFLMGRMQGSNYQTNFDAIMRSSMFIKIIEGNYKNRS